MEYVLIGILLIIAAVLSKVLVITISDALTGVENNFIKNKPRKILHLQCKI